MSRATRNILFILGLILGLIAIFFASAQRMHDQVVPGGESDTSDGGVACIQVITPAKNASTGEVRDFPTPCDVPAGWDTL